MKNNIEIVEPDVLEDVDISEMTDIINEKQIVVFNDDVNSFDHVIDTFCSILKHEPNQAHQCALIIHHNGKCSVKKGNWDMLLPMCEALLENQITAEIQ